jgi:S1-C subfamily serine protease
VLVILALALPSSANASVDLINSQGATAPCIGIGPIGGPVAEYCAQQYEANGFVRIAQVGVTGLTLGDSGDQDGVVTAVAPDSAAARAGFIVGDVIASVDGQPVRPSPGAVASQQLFGKVGDKVKITLVRAGSPMTLAVGRTLQAEPAGPTSTNPLIAIKPLVDWKGRFVPCIGAGPLGFAAIAFCNNHFKPYGFYPVTVAGGPGLEMDLARADAAVVKSVDPQSPAALAGVQPGDEITAIGGLDIKDSRAQVANSLMFGKIGDRRRVIVQRAGRARPLTLVLAAKVQP